MLNLLLTLFIYFFGILSFSHLNVFNFVILFFSNDGNLQCTCHYKSNTAYIEKNNLLFNLMDCFDVIAISFINAKFLVQRHVYSTDKNISFLCVRNNTVF